MALLRNIFLYDKYTWALNYEICMFKLIMSTRYLFFLRLRRSIDIIVRITIWLMFTTYDYLVMVDLCFQYMIIQSWLVDVRNIWLFSHGWCYLYWGSIVYIFGMNYHGLFSSSIIGCRVFEFGVYNIWLWRSCCIALHYMAFGVISMVATVPVQNRFLGMTMQFHILLGMKAGVHIHPYAYIIGLA